MADSETAPSEQTFPTVDAYLADKREKEAAAAPKDTDPAPETGDDTEIDAAAQAGDGANGEPEAANPDGADDGAEGEPEPAIAPPQFWDAEGKAEFAKLSKEAQRAVLKYEQQRSAAVARKLNEVSKASKDTEARQQALQAQMQRLEGFVAEADRELAEYAQVNWAQEIEDATTPEELKNVQWHQARFERLKQQRAQAENERSQAERQELQQFHREQAVKLKSISAELDITTKEGAQRVGQLSQFLAANGIGHETQAWMPAEGMALAYDAFRYRALMAKGGVQNTPQQPQKPPAGPTVKPASSSSGSSANQRLAKLQSKGTLSSEEFLEMQRLKRKAK